MFFFAKFFVEISLPVPKKIFEGFLTIYGHGGHLGHMTSIILFYIHIWFSLPIDASYKIWL